MGERRTPTCHKCGGEMSPEDSRIYPEYFIHDKCLPDHLRESGPINPYQDVIDRLRRENWNQRQDSTIGQLQDILPIIHALGCRDAEDAIRQLILQRLKRS